MIPKKTVFVLGAGASQPFGFPSGEELWRKIYHDTENPLGKPIAKLEIYHKDGFNSQKIEHFRKTLMAAQVESIDKFLEFRREFIPLGKCFILTSILEFERIQKIQTNPDWYQLLWRKMRTTQFEDFEKNNVSFITFNYDRSLEYYLMTSMAATYNKPLSECLNKLRKLPIIHVHGHLGMLEEDKTQIYTEFGENIFAHGDLSASKNIKIVHENIDSDVEFQQAHELLKVADEVVFLGHGYERKNLERLKINEVQCRIYGTGFKVNHTDRSRILKLFPNLIILDEKLKCNDYLMHHVEYE